MRFELGGGKAIELARGDITAESTDAIVNAANSSLMGGGGVDGAIHRAGGPAILDECKAIVAKQGYLEDGQVVATTGGRLKARYVLHTSGPVYEDGTFGEAETLASCYRESIRLADRMGLKTLAFPSISTGTYGYPVHLAAPVAVAALAEAMNGVENVTLARFILFDDLTFAAYRDAAKAFAEDSR
ncbi:MAG: hypothetical protein JWN86_2592 [Planctomycetota bacterium]|nr:hypothetical protein [Planctomycetota bacterium]